MVPKTVLKILEKHATLNNVLSRIDKSVDVATRFATLCMFDVQKSYNQDEGSGFNFGS